MQEQFNTYTFPSGMRLVHVFTPSDVSYAGIAIDAGTRDENEEEQGMAHFCEHMMFKGTTKRRAWHILNRMEAVGGDLNAYTNKEETVVHAAFLKQHLYRAAELITDIVFHSTYPQREIDKEVEVIAEEIDSYNDSPSELIFDEFENLIYQGHSLGHDILGRIDQLRQYTSDDALRFTKRLYRPERMVFFVLGHYDFAEVKRTVLRALRSAEVEPIEQSPSEVIRPIRSCVTSFSVPVEETDTSPIVHDRHTHQAHVMLGCRAYGSDDDRRIALYFLNNLLAGPGMNSRLNVSLRERRGLVYTVESSLCNYTDTSTFSIYFGCDTTSVDTCLRLIRKELDQLMRMPLSPRQFDAALKQIKGQIGVACDSSENYILDIAKSYLHYDKIEGMDDTFRHLDALTPALLQSVAQEIFNTTRLRLLIYR